MAFRVIIADPATLDIKDVLDFISRDSKERARAWYFGVRSTVDLLREHPARFATIPESFFGSRLYHQVLYHSRRVIYRIDELVEVVYVVRMYHQARKPLERGDLE